MAARAYHIDPDVEELVADELMDEFVLRSDESDFDGSDDCMDEFPY